MKDLLHPRAFPLPYLLALVVAIINIILWWYTNARFKPRYPPMYDYESEPIVKKLLDAQSALDLADGVRRTCTGDTSALARESTRLRDHVIHLMSIMEYITNRAIMREEHRPRARSIFRRDPDDVAKAAEKLLYDVEKHAHQVSTSAQCAKK